MNDALIQCPNCNSEIKLTESLAAPLVETSRRQFQEKLAQINTEFQKKELHLAEKASQLQKSADALSAEIEEKMKIERQKIAQDEARKAQLIAATEMAQKTAQLAELQTILKQRDEKLAEAQQAHAEVLRKQRELDDAKRELDITVEKKIQEGITAVRDMARKEVEDQLGLKVKEKEETISSMQKQIEELRRKADQGSQQLQGEVLELELESILRSTFPYDSISPVPKGEFGGDIVQSVVNTVGQGCGKILWETKRTKNWTDTWLPKLREDQRTAKADVAIIVSHALPKAVEGFELIDGVWVAHPKVMIPVATILRQSLIEIAAARQTGEGQQTKMEMVYQYLTGPRFRQRVQAIVEAFSSMQEDLDREKRLLTKQWAKREEQINRVMAGTVGLYGDLQGIAGKSLQEIDGLDLPRLESHHQDTLI